MNAAENPSTKALLRESALFVDLKLTGIDVGVPALLPMDNILGHYLHSPSIMSM